MILVNSSIQFKDRNQIFEFNWLGKILIWTTFRILKKKNNYEI